MQTNAGAVHRRPCINFIARQISASRASTSSLFGMDTAAPIRVTLMAEAMLARRMLSARG